LDAIGFGIHGVLIAESRTPAMHRCTKLLFSARVAFLLWS
jgi:hypothetical protein